MGCWGGTRWSPAFSSCSKRALVNSSTAIRSPSLKEYNQDRISITLKATVKTRCPPIVHPSDWLRGKTEFAYLLTSRGLGFRVQGLGVLEFAYLLTSRGLGFRV